MISPTTTGANFCLFWCEFWLLYFIFNPAQRSDSEFEQCMPED